MQMAHCTLLHSANQMQVVLALGQSGVSNLALVRKKKTPSLSTRAFINGKGTQRIYM